MNAEIIVLIDGDGQHNPDEIPILVKPILSKEADIVNGSRFIANNGNKMPLYRRFGGTVLTALTNIGTRQKLSDSQNGFRAFSRNSFEYFALNQKGMAIESEMLIDAHMKITFTGMIRADTISKHPDVVAKMAKAGIIGYCMGIESPNPDTNRFREEFC